MRKRYASKKSSLSIVILYLTENCLLYLFQRDPSKSIVRNESMSNIIWWKSVISCNITFATSISKSNSATFLTKCESGHLKIKKSVS